MTEAQRSAHVMRRKEIWDERQSGQNDPIESKRDDGRGHRRREFSADTEENAGINKRVVNRSLARERAVREAGYTGYDVAHTSLDKGVELDALAKLSADERRALIDRAKQGEKVSARKPIQPSNPYDALTDDDVGRSHIADFARRPPL